MGCERRSVDCASFFFIMRRNPRSTLIIRCMNPSRPPTRLRPRDNPMRHRFRFGFRGMDIRKAGEEEYFSSGGACVSSRSWRDAMPASWGRWHNFLAGTDAPERLCPADRRNAEMDAPLSVQVAQKLRFDHRRQHSLTIAHRHGNIILYNNLSYTL